MPLRISLIASGLAFLILAATLALALFPEGAFAQGGPPPGGIIYYGEATVDGEPAPDGIEIIARVGDYESKPVTVAEGRYASLSVASPDSSHAGQTISFFLGDVPADQTDIYQPHGIPVIKTGFDLAFPNLPEPTPTPAPSVVPTDTPPTPVVPLPVPSPEIEGPMVFISGLVFIQGIPQVPPDSILVARIDDRYQSEPAAVIATNGTYGGLVVDPGDGSFEGSEIRFFLNGVAARTTAVYQSGKLERTFDILFTEYPTPIPTQTPSPVSTPTPEPTNTPAPISTPTPLPPTSTPTPLPPTSTPTPLPPTSTPAPTQTSIPTPTPAPTNTAIPPTNTPVPTPEPTEPAQPEPPPTPTASPEESGGCFAVANVSPLTGAANALLLIAPLGLIVGLRRARSRQR